MKFSFMHDDKKSTDIQITFIGGGNMASAILEGCLAHDFSPELCHVVEVNPGRCTFLQQEYGVKTHSDIPEEIAHSHVIILAVKPQQMPEVTQKLQQYLKNSSINPLIISVAAGIRLEKLTQWLNSYSHIIRAMPNMASFVHAGITGLTALPSVTEEERMQAENLMTAIGDVIWFEEEKQLDAVTAVSGSGPAYVFYFIEALQHAGESLGLSAQDARHLAVKTFEGASHLAANSPESVVTLRERVTSKGGTTEAAIKHLDVHNVKQYFIEAIQAAEKRAEELGN